MNKSNLPLAIILTVLITVIVIAAVALIVVLSMDAPSTPAGTTPANTPEAVVTTTKKPADTTTTAATTTTKKPETTTKPDTTTNPTEPEKPTTTTKPAEQDKPVTTKPNTTTKPDAPTPTPTPGLSQISGTVKGDSIDSLGIYAKYVTQEINEEAKTMTVRFTFYLQSYGLRIGARGDNYLVVNGETHKKLATEKIDLPNGSPLTHTTLYEYVVEVEKPDDNTPVRLELEYCWHFQGTYAGEHADWLTVTVDLTI